MRFGNYGKMCVIACIAIAVSMLSGCFLLGPDMITVTFDSQNGDSVITQEIEIDSQAIQPETPVKKGYGFVGWYADKEGTGERWDFSIDTVTSDLTLYAVWTDQVYTLTLSDGDGTGGSGTVIAAFGGQMPEASMPILPGYEFGGYFTVADGSGDQYYSSNMSSTLDWDIEADTTLYANWVANTYSVTLDDGEGSGGSGRITVTYGEAMPTGATAPVPPPALAAEGYIFLGYFTEDGVKYYSSRMTGIRPWAVAEDTTLYARYGIQLPGAYITAASEPWVVNDNIDAMNAVFGEGEWDSYQYSTADIETLTADDRVLFLEGGDGNAQEMEDFLNTDTNLSDLEDWVYDGGILFLNSAPNVGDGMSYGFGSTQLVYSEEQSSVSIADGFYTTICGSDFTPLVQDYTGGSFSHAYVEGEGLTMLIYGTDDVESEVMVLAEKVWGNGLVVFGGMTMPHFHSPSDNGENQNLRKAILEYLSFRGWQ